METELATKAAEALTQIALYYAGAPIEVIAWAVALGGAVGGLFGIKTERKRERKAKRKAETDFINELESSKEGEEL